MRRKVLQWGQLGTRWLFLLGDRRGRLLVGSGRYVGNALALVPLPHEVLVVHATLNDEQASCYERLFEKLALEHLDEVFDPNIRFLLTGWWLHCRLPTRCLLLLQGEHLLLLLDSYLVALFQGELGVFTVDALRIYG